MMLHLFAIVLLVAAPDGPTPRPELGPGDVVWIQLDALRTNDKKGKDAGIAIVFRFASPSNRAVTGPLDHFAEIVKSPGYRPMIGHRVAGVGPLVVVDNLALQRVIIIAADGRALEYEFRLSKDPQTKCWSNDGVVPIPDSKAKPIGPVI